MSNNKVSVDLSGICSTLLVITFIVLKTTGFINWSWWWVFAPYWIPVALVAIVLLFIFLVSLL